MLMKTLIASCLLVTSMASQATIISHFGYARDSASSIVKGGGLEWLKWDVTKGASINSALATYAKDGWSLATNTHITTLFNAFQFGKSDWIDKPIAQSHWLPGNLEGVSIYKDFIELFGETAGFREQCFEPWMGLGCVRDSFSFAKYGVLAGNSEFIPLLASVVIAPDIYADLDQFMGGYVGYGYDDYWSDGDDTVGIALVRPATTDVTPVPLPTSISLLALGLFALGYRRRQGLRR